MSGMRRNDLVFRLTSPRLDASSSGTSRKSRWDGFLPGLSIEGIVHGPSGAGLLEVLMIAQAKSKGPRESAYDPVGRAPHLARPDASGAFQCVGLAEGDYELSVDRAPAEFEPYESSVVRAGTTGVDVVFRVGLSALVTVLDATGAPLDVTMVEVETTAIDREGRDPRLPGHFYRSYFTDSTGIARVIGLRAGVAYSLRVEAPGHFVFDRAPWTPADTTIRLDRAYTVTGVVKDPDGAPVPQASVYWSAPGARQQWRAVEADCFGHFYLNQVGAGGVDLVATLGLASSTGPGGAEGEPIHVAAGAEDVTLTLDFGQELTVKIENWPCGAPGRLATLDRERASGSCWEFRHPSCFVGWRRAIPRFAGRHDLSTSCRAAPQRTLVSREGIASRSRSSSPVDSGEIDHGARDCAERDRSCPGLGIGGRVHRSRHHRCRRPIHDPRPSGRRLRRRRERRHRRRPLVWSR